MKTTEEMQEKFTALVAVLNDLTMEEQTRLVASALALLGYPRRVVQAVQECHQS